MSPVTVGAVQAEPVYLDLDGAVTKTISLIAEAAEKGVQVLGFPEVWVGGYPWPIWTQNAYTSFDFATKYRATSLELSSPQMQRIQDACAEHNVYVVLGYSERDGGSIYMSQAFISNTGTILHNRRKIKPTHAERTLWGEGQSPSLTCVVDTPLCKLGALNCWENMQPLLRYYEYSQGAQIHVAGWPAFPWKSEDVTFPYLYNCSGEANYRLSQVVAMEGQMFVICATQVVKRERLDGGGFAMIFGPDGTPLVERLAEGEEGILTANVDLDDILAAKNVCDPVGHYSRPDLLSLNVNLEEAKVVHHKS
ncbi:carbon-nitrogen hydrolase [Aspergillus steynii IBT 23096]|uniref:nitrilase n=1 Tax=Aspergillus steynii IBT 23096 TaxID=1392250 RepID=A0A2I2G118_9EURO|nr:carbon-nitrogen hydrolase [Aspergillus steynii IBT 23096]PLB46536.1 carbon-nitrogen hydrolase [Aspergillus steynii IBT 23096]